MRDFFKNNKTLIIAIVTTILYALFTLNSVFSHEVWADEAQVWMLCKNLSISELFSHLKNEGHPILFYLLVFPFAKMFSNIIFMKLLCWLFMCTSVFLLMYFAPFKLYTKLAVVLSAGFLYFFPVLARNYSIIPFLVFFAAILYNKQKEHPILYAINITLSANTHIIMFFFSFCLAIKFFFETIISNIKKGNHNLFKKFFVANTIIWAGFIAVIMILSHTTNSNAFIYINTNDLVQTTKKVLSLFFLNSINYSINTDKIYPSSAIEAFATSSLIITYILLFINLFINNKKLFLIALSSIGFQLSIYILGYNAHIYTNRIFCAHIILLFCFWQLIENQLFKSNSNFFKEKATNILLCILFGLTIYNGINYTYLDKRLEYSASKSTAKYIEENVSAENSLILSDLEQYMIAVAYYLNEKHNMFSIQREKELKYVIWDEKNKFFFKNHNWKKRAKYYKETKNKEIYIVLPFFIELKELDKEFPNDFQLVYESKIPIEPYEGHKIYKYIGE